MAGRRFFTRTLALADTDEDGLVDRVEKDERFGDALATAAQKAISSGDEQRRIGWSAFSPAPLRKTPR